MAGTNGQTHEALLRGWLRDVDPDAKTALLHDFAGNAIPLRFSRDLGDALCGLETRHVEVRGSGRFNGNDEWVAVEVASIVATGSPRDTLPVATKPRGIVTASEPFDVDEFNRSILAGRGA